MTGTKVPVGKGTFVPTGTFVPIGKGTFVPFIFPTLSRASTPLSTPLLRHTKPAYYPQPCIYLYVPFTHYPGPLYPGPSSPSDRVLLYPALPALPTQTHPPATPPSMLPSSVLHLPRNCDSPPPPFQAYLLTPLTRLFLLLFQPVASYKASAASLFRSVAL